MDQSLYDMIFRRKSFHSFRPERALTEQELIQVREAVEGAEPLFDGIRTEIVTVPASETTGSRNAEYCLLFYSEQKDGWLQNIGYLGEQIDLKLTALGIGTLWLGLGRTAAKERNGLKFVIMIAFAKVSPELFRKDVTRSKRREFEEFWQGPLPEEARPVRWAPSACNSQPWRVQSSGSTLRVLRSSHRAGIIPAALIGTLNRIDMGIFLCFLDLCLLHGKGFSARTVYPEPDGNANDVLNAEYTLKI